MCFIYDRSLFLTWVFLRIDSSLMSFFPRIQTLSTLWLYHFQHITYQSQFICLYQADKMQTTIMDLIWDFGVDQLFLPSSFHPHFPLISHFVLSSLLFLNFFFFRLTSLPRLLYFVFFSFLGVYLYILFAMVNCVSLSVSLPRSVSLLFIIIIIFSTKSIMR